MLLIHIHFLFCVFSFLNVHWLIIALVNWLLHWLINTLVHEPALSLSPSFTFSISWVTPLFSIGNKRRLEEDDMYQVLPDDASQGLGEELQRYDILWPSSILLPRAHPYP